MIDIRYISPFSLAHPPNIGGEYNRIISELPDDCWICLRDWDTLPLTPNSLWGHQIYDIIEKYENCYHLIGCLTNRLAGTHQLYQGKFSDEADINVHLRIAEKQYNEEYDIVNPINNAVAGMFMLFPKWVWQQFKFVENLYTFDTAFSQSILSHGGKIGVAQGIYIFHLYRFGKKNPKQYKKHLLL